MNCLAPLVTLPPARARLLRPLLLALALLASVESHAVDVGATQVDATTAAKSTASSDAVSHTAIWSANDSTLAQLWSLSIPEVQRARILMQGPRGAFSSPQLSPIEALGIHARTDAERDRYARLFAKVTLEDTQRVLAWSNVAQAEMQRITAGMPVMSFENVPKAAVSNETADMLGVPHSAVVPPKHSAPVVKTNVQPNKAVGRAVDNHGRTAVRAVKKAS